MSINGLRTDAPKYSQATKDHVTDVVKELRPYIFRTDSMERGSRFNSNEYIIWILESNFDEKTLMSNTYQWVLAALIEAGKSDYWYSNEKDWE